MIKWVKSDYNEYWFLHFTEHKTSANEDIGIYPYTLKNCQDFFKSPDTKYMVLSAYDWFNTVYIGRSLKHFNEIQKASFMGNKVFMYIIKFC